MRSVHCAYPPPWGDQPGREWVASRTIQSGGNRLYTPPLATDVFARRVVDSKLWRIVLITSRLRPAGTAIFLAGNSGSSPDCHEKPRWKTRSMKAVSGHASPAQKRALLLARSGPVQRLDSSFLLYDYKIQFHLTITHPHAWCELHAQGLCIWRKVAQPSHL